MQRRSLARITSTGGNPAVFLLYFCMHAVFGCRPGRYHIDILYVLEEISGLTLTSFGPRLLRPPADLPRPALAVGWPLLSASRSRPRHAVPPCRFCWPDGTPLLFSAHQQYRLLRCYGAARTIGQTAGKEPSRRERERAAMVPAQTIDTAEPSRPSATWAIEMHHWSISCSIIHFEWDRPFVAALRGVSAACTPWLSTMRVRGEHIRVSEVPAGPTMRRSQAVGRFGLAYLGLRGWISPVPVRADKLLYVSVRQAKCFCTCWSTG